MLRSESLPPQWEEIRANSREQLKTMMRELEIPYAEELTLQQMRNIIQTFIEKPHESKNDILKIYTTERHRKKFPEARKFLQLLILIFLGLGLFEIFRFLFSPAQYCLLDGPQKYYFKQCVPCPDQALCTKRKATCSNNSHILTSVGCRPAKYTNQYRIAAYAAGFVHSHDGNCFSKQNPITTTKFQKLFPRANSNIYELEPGFHIQILKGNESDPYLLSLKPNFAFGCQQLQAIESDPSTTGAIIFAVLFLSLFYLYRKKYQENLEIARDLAKQAHKIMATSDRQIYMYDIKVQLRAKYMKIDSIWKHVVKFIEQDSHVLVGAEGARKEVYWKWIQSHV